MDTRRSAAVDSNPVPLYVFEETKKRIEKELNLEAKKLRAEKIEAEKLRAKKIEAEKEKQKARYKANREKIIEKVREYQRANQEIVDQYHKEYLKTNREKINQKQKERYKKKKKHLVLSLKEIKDLIKRLEQIEKAEEIEIIHNKESVLLSSLYDPEVNVLSKWFLLKTYIQEEKE